MSAEAIGLFDLADVAPSAPRPERSCPACGGDNDARHRSDPRCSRCIRAGIDAPTLLGLAGTIHTPATIEPEQTPTQAHRARCSGTLMRPVFGIGRTNCIICDWSPTDEPTTERTAP